MDAPNLNYYRVQLKDFITGQSIISAGGVCIVTGAGSPLRTALKNADGTTKANAFTLSRGLIEFYTANTVNSVDLFIDAPGGQFLVATGVTPSGPNEVVVNTASKDHVMVIPCHITDFPAAAETDTGFDTLLTRAFKPSPSVWVTAIDATETLDVGTAAGSDDPNGFIAALPVGVLGRIKATLLASGATMGALLSVLDSANAGDDAPEMFVDSASGNITATTTAGSDTFEGYIFLPYFLLTL